MRYYDDARKKLADIEKTRGGVYSDQIVLMVTGINARFYRLKWEGKSLGADDYIGDTRSVLLSPSIE